MTAVGNMHSNVLLFYKKTQYIMISSVAAAALNVALNYIMIPIYGYQAASYTTLFAYIVLAVIQMVVGRWTERRERGAEEGFIYDTKLLIMISASLIILSIACVPLYGTLLLRYAIVCIVVGIGLKYRKVFIEKMKMIKRK